MPVDREIEATRHAYDGQSTYSPADVGTVSVIGADEEAAVLGHEIDVPQNTEHSNVAYGIMILLGVGLLLPWNMALNAYVVRLCGQRAPALACVLGSGRCSGWPQTRSTVEQPWAPGTRAAASAAQLPMRAVCYCTCLLWPQPARAPAS